MTDETPNNLPATRPTHSIAEMERMAAAVAKSNLFGMKRPEEALALMLIAQAEGKHPASAAMEYDVIQGRPALKSTAILARFQLAGGSVRWIESTDARCVGEFSHPQGGTIRITWDIQRAQRAGLAGKPTWKQYPAAMLRARVVSEAVRAVFPACLNGIYASEEVQDFDDRRQPTPETRPAGEAVAAVVRTEAGDAVDTTTGEVVEEQPAAQEEPKTTAETTGQASVRMERKKAIAYVKRTLDAAYPSAEFQVGKLSILKDVLGRGHFDAVEALDDDGLYNLIRLDNKTTKSRLTRTVELVSAGYRRPDTIDPALWPPATDEELDKLLEEGVVKAPETSDGEVW